MRRTVRGRLTAWYLVVLAAATVTLALGSIWLLHRSLIVAADTELRARVNSVSGFMVGVVQLEHEDMLDEFQEYAKLSPGDALLEVREIGGAPLVTPDQPDWLALRAVADAAARPGETATAAAQLAGRPMRVAVLDVTVRDRPYRIVAAMSMRAADAALERFQAWIAGLAPLVLLIAGAGGYALSRRALAPLDAMTGAASAITLRHLDRRLDVPSSGDELQRLALTFNAMLARLQSAVQDLTRLTADASHELRTPVTIVRATADVALSQPRSAEEYRQALVDVLTHAEGMSTLVDDLLVLSRLDAGAEVGETGPLDLQSVVDDAVRRISAAAEQRGLTVTPPERDARHWLVDGPAEALRRLFVIVLDNAVKYTNKGGRITIAVEAGEAAAVTVRVADDGIGLDPEDQDRVFDRFYRGGRARRHVADGAGLGLAIARVIVSRQHGTIAVEPGPNRVGCVVRITLPSLPADPMASPTAASGAAAH